MRYHRLVLRRSNKINNRWQDVPGWQDLSIDFGHFGQDQINETMKKIQEQYPDHRIVRHFAITQAEMYNGLTHKLHNPQ